ncbi:hypothetical protein [Aquimarina celericrescens]|uniref:Cold-shock protein n=1 Tax=Aquimarina celericrescens TaxID=1964542 RepID=A0ABW5ATB3_9FLAO
MNKKKNTNDVILADMHDDGVRFNENLKAKKKQKEIQEQKINELEKKGE